MDDVARPGDSALGTPGQAPRFIRANLGVIMLVTFAVIAGAAVVSWSRTSMFTSTAEVLVVPRSYTTGAAQLPDMATEKALASSGTVLGTASQTLAVPAGQLSRALSITVPVDTRVLRIAYSHPDPREARRRAQGIAQAYVTDANRNDLAAQPHAAIITAASLPDSPASPRHVVDLGVGLVLGLVLGLGVALVRDRLDDRFRSLADFEAHVGAPVLGVIPATSRAASNTGASVVVIGDADSDAADAYRDVRTRLLQIADGQPAKSVLVASPAGDDKAAVAANLAAVLAVRGRQVVLVCAEVCPRGAFEGLGVEGSVGLTDMVDGIVDLAHALCVTGVSGLQVVTAGTRVRDPGAMWQSDAMKRTLEELRDAFDVTVLAAPPVLGSAGTSILAESVEMVLLVGDARRSTRADVVAATHQLGSSREKLVGCVMDNVRKRRQWPWMRRRSKVRKVERTIRLLDSDGTIRNIYPNATSRRPAAKVPPGTKEIVGQVDGRRPLPSDGTK